MSRAEEIQQALAQYADPVKQEVLPRFFKTGKGEYGEGDQFLGVIVPHTRLVAKLCKDEPFEVAQELLQSPWHECRLCALLMLVERFKKAKADERQHIFDFYLTQTARINNWDLVDLSAPAIVGGYLLEQPRKVLYTLAKSPLLWDRRIAIVSTLTFIRRNDFADTICLSKYFLAQQGRMHDLMQKAIGWMLREMGKRDKELLIQFLEKHAHTMPRTTLRYAIEKFSAKERAYFMRRKVYLFLLILGNKEKFLFFCKIINDLLCHQTSVSQLCLPIYFGIQTAMNSI